MQYVLFIRWNLTTFGVLHANSVPKRRRDALRPRRMATAQELREEARRLREIASSGKIESPDPQLVAMSLLSEAASLMWAASAREHVEAQGKEFFDYKHTWLPARELAIRAYRRACDRSRRKSGDREILERLESARSGAEDASSYKLTPARGKVIAAIVRMASDSGRLFCSYLTLARRAGVSARTACAVRSELEGLGILERVRTGGKAADGSCHSNKYTVKWNALRDVLGIPNRWESRYPLDTRGMFTRSPVPNVYYSYEGYAHYSQSERQRRRLAQRARISKAAHAEKALQVGLVVAENPLVDRQSNFDSMEENANDQVFCALTELIKQNKPNTSQPERTLLLEYNGNVENSCQNEAQTQIGGLINNKLQCRLSRATDEKRRSILAELQAHLQQTPNYAPKQTMVEDYLLAVLNAEHL